MFADCDLSQCLGLETIKHPHDSSTIGTDTLVRTLRGAGGTFTDAQLVFFENAGVPGILLEHLPGLLQTEPLQFYSCFISYGTGDEAFATALDSALRDNGIRCYKWNVDTPPGRELRQVIDQAIRTYEKLILVCSEHSLDRAAVHDEIERALRKEGRLKEAKAEAERRARERHEPAPHTDVDVLVPVMLDSYVLNSWGHHYQPDVTKKFIPDFSGWETDEAKFQQRLDELIAALDPRSGPLSTPR